MLALRARGHRGGGSWGWITAVSTGFSVVGILA